MEHDDFQERPMQVIDTSALSALSRAEIDGQIATAHAFPRSVANFLREAKALVSLDADTAEACIYSLPRKDKNGKQVFISGPSIRFAEIIRYSYGNSRSGGRVVSIDGENVTGQGVFHDLEKNVMVTQEVQRRITTSAGKRFNADMIQVTGNAAISLAQRNAILGGVPKAVWLPVYELAKRVAVGDVSTLLTQRARALEWFTKAGITEAQVLEKLQVKGPEDIGLDHLVTLAGIRTAIRDGQPVDSLFAPDSSEGNEATAAFAQRVADARAKAETKPESTVETKAGNGVHARTNRPAKDLPADPASPTAAPVDNDAPLPDGSLFTAEPGAKP